MLFTRITAVITALVLIAVITLVSIGLMQSAGSVLRHGPGVQMDGGFVGTFITADTFTFKTDKGVVERFQCIERCLNDHDHMLRHISEHAHTNIYYMRTPNGLLYAVDVD